MTEVRATANLNELSQVMWGRVPRVQPLQEHFEVRHGLPHHLDGFGDDCESDVRFRCRCSGELVGLDRAAWCCARITGEDLRCDECRDWCYIYTYPSGETISTTKYVSPLMRNDTHVTRQIERLFG